MNTLAAAWGWPGERNQEGRQDTGGAGEGGITSVEFGWKIEFLFHVLGAVVIPGHCGEKTDLDERGVVLSANGPWLLTSIQKRKTV